MSGLDAAPRVTIGADGREIGPRDRPLSARRRMSATAQTGCCPTATKLTGAALRRRTSELLDAPTGTPRGPKALGEGAARTWPSPETVMDYFPLLTAMLVLLPALGLAAWGWLVMEQIEDDLRSLRGYLPADFEIA